MTKFIYLFSLSLLISITCIYGQKGFKNTLNWEELPEIPPAQGEDLQHGLAQPFAGVSNGALIVAGGANFPNKPVHEGGKKVYHKDVFVLIRDNFGVYKWLTGFELPSGVAYGVSIQLNDGVLCIGGCNENGALSSAFLLRWNNEKQEIEIEKIPSLPFGMYEMGGDVLDETVYLAGGMVNSEASNFFLSLNLKMKGTNNFKWELLDPFPGFPRIQPVGVAQNYAEEKHFFLFSGSFNPPDRDPVIMTDGLAFNPKENKWRKIADIKPKGGDYLSLHGASGIPVGIHSIAFIGGANKEILLNAWNRGKLITKAKDEGDIVTLEKLEIETIDYFLWEPKEYKFNNKILVYHTITDTWNVISDYPYPGPAGAPMVKWNNNWVVVNGELKPGIRSPKVYMGTIVVSPKFGIINWVVVIVYLIGMLGLGYFFMKKEQGTNDFFKGGGRIPWWAAGVSIFATMLSAITFMAIPAKTYATNWLYFTMAITIFIMVSPVIKFYLPFFKRLNVTTAYEYLEARFNYFIRALASSVFLIFMVARMALVLFLPSLALTTVTGINIYTCIILMGLITIIYCTMGGIEAVVWTEFIQGIVLIGGAILALIFLIAGTDGGLLKIVEININNEKMKTFDFAFNITRATFWVVLLGGLANNLIAYSSDQTIIQKYMTVKNEEDAAKGIWLNGGLSIIVSIIFYSIGTVLFAYYKTQPHELNIAMENADSIFPHFIMSKMPVGIAGLMIAAIFSATMSTVSSNINSISTAFIIDFYSRFFPHTDDKKRLLVARYIGVFFGTLGVGFALLMATWNILSLFDYFNIILGLLTSGLAALFVMGIFFRRIHTHGALIGFIGGTSILFWIRGNSDIHFLLYGFLGLVFSVSIAYFYCLAFPGKPKELKGLTYKTLLK